MRILSTVGWDDYRLLDSGEGYRLERFGEYCIARPDPQCMWMRKLGKEAWERAEAIFARDINGRDRWAVKNKLPETWLIRYKSLNFYARLTAFKHTGIFSEQHLQWDWMADRIQNRKLRIANYKPRILNLFAYTGIASLVAAENNCEVTHVDASSPSISWARENQLASGLMDKPIRWIKDDVLKFCARELRRGHRYDGIIMDPPVYGHGPGGEVWDFYKDLPKLMSVCSQLLTRTPIFFLINAYAISSSSIMLNNVLCDYIKDFGGKIDFGELCLQEQSGKRLLSTGIFARWSSE